MTYIKTSPDSQPAKKLLGRRSGKKELNKKLLKIKKAKPDLLSNVRNEVNNSLPSILGLLESISHLTTDERIIQLCKLVRLDTFELDFQTRNIIAAAEIDSSKIKIKPSRVDIVSVIEKEINYLLPRLYCAKVTIGYQVESKLLFDTDSYLFQTIITNLLTNAIDFSKDETKIEMKARRQEERLVVELKYFGSGNYMNMSAGTTKLHRSHALGLTVAKEFVSLIEGEIGFNSKSEKETTITLQIPELKSSSGF